MGVPTRFVARAELLGVPLRGLGVVVQAVRCVEMRLPGDYDHALEWTRGRRGGGGGSSVLGHEGLNREDKSALVNSAGAGAPRGSRGDWGIDSFS